jgi:hypothetical protein
MIFKLTPYGQETLRAGRGAIPRYAQIWKVYKTGSFRFHLYSKTSKRIRKTSEQGDWYWGMRIFEMPPLALDQDANLVPWDQVVKGPAVKVVKHKMFFIYNPRWESGFGEYPPKEWFAESIAKAATKDFGFPRFSVDDRGMRFAGAHDLPRRFTVIENSSEGIPEKY